MSTACTSCILVWVMVVIIIAIGTVAGTVQTTGTVNAGTSLAREIVSCYFVEPESHESRPTILFRVNIHRVYA